MSGIRVPSPKKADWQKAIQRAAGIDPRRSNRGEWHVPDPKRPAAASPVHVAKWRRRAEHKASDATAGSHAQ